ncbi:MAG: UDP-glycosyltransferase [Burkholderiaceae bacterium]
MKKVLFVTYGSGHVKMVLPVARALAASGLAQPVVLALTTAAPVVRESGLALLQFKDFLTAADAEALAQGHSLMASLNGQVVDELETAAYLGLSFSDLVAAVGRQEALARYASHGRQAFVPVRTLQRILRQVAPDVVVATNSPRAERAAIVAARELGIPSVCIVDLFAIDEVKWIGAPDYADQVCVLNDSVKRFLVAAGRAAEQVSVTGNPGFDALFDPGLAAQGRDLRQRMGWQGRHVVLWPAQTEPAVHPFDGRAGDPSLPGTVLQALLEWVGTRDDCVLCVRPRAGEPAIDLPDDRRFVLTGQDWKLPPLLCATDLVVTLSSTVGLEGRLVGARLIQVLGSVFDEAMPVLRYGLVDEAVPAAALAPALQRQIGQPRHGVTQATLATHKVLEVVRGFL